MSAHKIESIARGRRWLDELIAEQTPTTESIAKRERCSVRKVNMTISLAFLAPDLVKAAFDGDSRMGWELPASPTCQPNGPASTRCSALLRSTGMSETSRGQSEGVAGAAGDLRKTLTQKTLRSDPGV
jgi:hypothetical protein